MSNPDLLGIIFALVGCFVGLTGWLSGRDKKIANDAEWRGTVNAKLDIIIDLRKDVACLEEEVRIHGERISTVESSVESAHRRLDGIKISQ